MKRLHPADQTVSLVIGRRARRAGGNPDLILRLPEPAEFASPITSAVVPPASGRRPIASGGSAGLLSPLGELQNLPGFGRDPFRPGDEGRSQSVDVRLAGWKPGLSFQQRPAFLLKSGTSSLCKVRPDLSRRVGKPHSRQALQSPLHCTGGPCCLAVQACLDPSSNGCGNSHGLCCLSVLRSVGAR